MCELDHRCISISTVMNHDSTTQNTSLKRRDAIMRVLQGTAAVAFAAPAVVRAAPTASPPAPEPEFVPENDYPFFGSEPPEGF
jgi:hypothetical protein